MPTNTESFREILEIEAFIQTCRVEGQDGALWRRTPGTDEVPHTLYHGSAGVALFYLELHRATGSTRFLDEATIAADELLAYLRDQPFITVAIYSGLPGYQFVLNEAAKASITRCDATAPACR